MERSHDHRVVAIFLLAAYGQPHGRSEGPFTKGSDMTTELGVQDVARYFLAKQRDGDISNLKLQKLVYYAQGMSFAVRGRPLWSDRRVNHHIKAWDHGPVVPLVYHEYKEWDFKPIPRVRDLDDSTYDDQSRQILDMVFQSFGRLSATRLRDMTHAEAPWLEAHERSQGERDDNEISDASLAAFFAAPTGATGDVVARALWDHMRRTQPGWDAEAEQAHRDIQAGHGLSLAELRSSRGL